MDYRIDRDGNALYPNDIVASSNGKIFKLRNSDFKGIGSMHDDWFASLLKINNLEDFVRDNVTVTIK